MILFLLSINQAIRSISSHRKLIYFSLSCLTNTQDTKRTLESKLIIFSVDHFSPPP